ncbi:hypothetical protein [Massilia phosphatilytica]
MARFVLALLLPSMSRLLTLKPSVATTVQPVVALRVIDVYDVPSACTGGV